MPGARSTPAIMFAIVVVAVILAILISFALVLVTFNFTAVLVAVVFFPILDIVYRSVKGTKLKEFSQALAAAVGGCLIAVAYSPFILGLTVLRNRVAFCLPSPPQYYLIYLGIMITGIIGALVMTRMQKARIVNPALAFLLSWALMSTLISFSGWLCPNII